MRFRNFIIFSLIITIGLAGLSFGVSESANKHVSAQSTRIERNQSQEAIDREAAILKNIEARRDDCENNNELREGLRVGVELGKKNDPLLLKLLPSLNTKEVLTVVHREEQRELKAYAPLNCQSYALRAAPASARTKLTLQVQQREIENLVHQLQLTEKKEHEARLVTVRQRCELTQLVISNTTKPRIRAKLVTSYKNCEKQLALIEADK